MRTDLFDFSLPDSLIATHPAEPRESARLLYVSDVLADNTIRDLPSLLQQGDLLVFNDTKVIPARLFGKRGEAKVELLLLKKEERSREKGEEIWTAFAKPAKKLRIGDVILFSPATCDLLPATFDAEVLAKTEGEVTVRFNLSGAAFDEALMHYGVMPLPPYITRAANAKDASDYQTIYARQAGAVAAPTAGLHFAEGLMQALDARGIQKTFVTLHVGAGTFLPVKVEDTAAHRMHSEWYSISEEAARAINAAKAEGRRVVAVGTTSLRTLESAADAQGRVKAGSADTEIFITPGHHFKCVDALFTNFHLPKSTLFMLVCAFAGLERMKAAYAHAMAEGYRFYSYGDACLLERS